jgi:hypothetical protein
MNNDLYYKQSINNIEIKKSNEIMLFITEESHKYDYIFHFKGLLVER